jgi:hypothetical protein
MNIPSPIFVGYFPKITAQRNDLKTNKGEIWLKNEIVEEICSVSECISKGPDGWIDEWKHNDLGFYDTEESALSVCQEDQEKYDLYAYKLYTVKFIEGNTVDFKVDSSAKEHLNSYKFIGYDVVSKSESDFFECSVLSCNNGCEIFPVNKFCLIQDFRDALTCCSKISEDIAGAETVKRPDGVLEYHGKWEPGPYYLFEVFRKMK